jgi:ABC-type cobalt transport system substrate-binding protein
MTKKITTIHNKHNIASQMYESVSETTNTAYYVFVGDQYDRPEILDMNESNKDITFNTYQNMIMGKRVTPDDIKLVIRNVPYVSNTVYTSYDDEDQDLINKDFYAVVNASSYYHVYKCLDNNGGIPSTVTPDIAHIIGANTSLYETSDGYRWKYMYSISSAENTKFSTTDFFPIKANNNVMETAVDGSIDIIKVEDGGKRYDNYLEGSFTATQIKVNSNSYLYEITNSNISTSNGFYTNCLIYISSGTGVGQYRYITDYISNSNGNYIVIDTEFDVTPTNASEYEIYPNVKIIGSGQTTNVVARAIINAYSTNSVYKIEILNRGQNYNYHSAYVEANDVIKTIDNFSEAVVRSIYVPPGGHGSSIENELFSSRLVISTEFANSESNTIPTSNKFNQVGILKDPMFANVNIRLQNEYGNFQINEKILKIKPIRVNINAICNTTSANITCADADWNNQLNTGEYVYLSTNNASKHQLLTVNSIVNSTVITVSSNASFESNDAWFYVANVSSNAYVKELVLANSIIVTNVQGIFESGDRIIGVDSGASGIVTNVYRNGESKSFNTFVQLQKMKGSLVSGQFIENETIYQSNLTTANATFHSIINTNTGITMYVSNAIGSFTSSNVYGSNSLAIASINDVYSGEILFGSGEILYLNNISAVERANTQKETFKIIFEF